MTTPQFGRIPYWLARSRITAKLSLSGQAVLFALCGHLNGRGDTTTVGVQTLTECTGLHRRSVQRALREIEQLRIIATVRRAGVPSIYQINGAVDKQLALFKGGGVGVTRGTDAAPQPAASASSRGGVGVQSSGVGAAHTERTDKKQSASPAALAPGGPPAATLERRSGPYTLRLDANGRAAGWDQDEIREQMRQHGFGDLVRTDRGDSPRSVQAEASHA